MDKVGYVNQEIIDVLKQKISDLQKECGMLKFDNEEIEVKFDALENEKIYLEDQIEESFAKIRKLSEINENMSKDNTEIKDDLIQTKNENQKNSLHDAKKRETLEKIKKEHDENLLMLENVITNNELEIGKLRKELDSVEASGKQIMWVNMKTKMVQLQT